MNDSTNSKDRQMTMVSQTVRELLSMIPPMQARRRAPLIASIVVLLIAAAFLGSLAQPPAPQVLAVTAGQEPVECSWETPDSGLTCDDPCPWAPVDCIVDSTIPPTTTTTEPVESTTTTTEPNTPSTGSIITTTTRPATTTTSEPPTSTTGPEPTVSSTNTINPNNPPPNPGPTQQVFQVSWSCDETVIAFTEEQAVAIASQFRTCTNPYDVQVVD